MWTEYMLYHKIVVLGEGELFSPFLAVSNWRQWALLSR